MATNFVNCSYQEIIDLHTESDHVTVLGVHTPTGSTPRKMFSGFFNQFKKYKYNGCSIKLVPAARLPVDPLQVGVEPGQVYETPMDPRDALNPIMFHGCHGNDMGQILDMLYGSQDISESMKGLDATTIGGTVLSQAFYDVMERLYYKALTDNTWKKAHPQRGFKKSGLRPLVYSVAANRQISPGALGDVFSLGENDEVIQEMGDLHQFTALDSVKVDKSNLQFFTPRLTSLGWMDTRNALTTEDAYDGSSASLDDLLNKFTNYSELPSIFMGCILLPPAYGVEQYFRMIINHSFSFKNFRGISFKPEVSSVPSYYDANADLFDPEQYEGGTVDPPEPEPPEPDPPLGGSTILYDKYAAGLSIQGGIYDTYATLQYSDNVDYAVSATVEQGEILSQNFVIPQSFVSGNDTDIGYYIVANTSASRMPYVDVDNTRYVNVQWVFVYGGSVVVCNVVGADTLIHTGTTITAGLTLGITPASEEVSGKLGTTTDFTSVTIGS